MMAASIRPASGLTERGDLYFCALASLCLGLYALLTRFDVLDEGFVGALPVAMLGASMLVLPGYSLCRALGLDRYGTAMLGGLSFALSLALLALAGAGSWLIAHELDMLAVETFVLGFTVTLCATAAMGGMRNSESERDASRSIRERWTALGLMLVPLLMGAIAFSPDMPVAAATRHTEFYVGAPAPALRIGIYNAEGRTVTYTLVAEDGKRRVSVGPIDLAAGGRWEGDTPLAPPTGGELHLYLYRYGIAQPYRSLMIAGDQP